VCSLTRQYNTGNAFKQYDDGLEHSIWLGLMRDRLEIIRRLLSDDGSLWITIDDNEAHYLKVMCDEIFGRANFIVNLAWHKRVSPANDAKFFSGDFDHILVYAKRRDDWRPIRLQKNDAQVANYKNPDNDPRGVWNSTAYTCAKTAEERPNLYYAVTNPNNGAEIFPSRTRVWAYDRGTHQRNVDNNLIYWGKDGNGSMPRMKKFLAESKPVVPRSIWSYDEAGHNQESRLEIDKLFPGDPFTTPKPERLLKRVVEIATNAGDLILDSFAGSGTTGAVAHKMGRRWIMVELGEHCHTHIVPRLQKVIDGQDPGGVTQATGWTGGGGFRYYELAPTLLSTDRWGNLVINPEYDAGMLSAAMCKLEGFSYAPSETVWWQQGRSSECDFIYVTTQTLGPEQLEALSHEVGTDPNDPRSLLVCCGAYRGVTAAQAAQRWPNLTLKKIPKMVKDRCEWGHDDYSLNVANLPMAQKVAEVLPPQDDLFGGDAA